MLDYIVVGLGLAGLAICEKLREHGKSFVVFNDDSQSASGIAGGLINPVILKRFNMAWMANEHLPIALDFYNKVQRNLNKELISELPVLRRFASIEEQNAWFQAADRPLLHPFLLPKVIPNNNPHILAPYGFGKVLQAHRLRTETLLAEYGHSLRLSGQLVAERFQYETLQANSAHVSYKGLMARHIVFADGFGLKKNPYFKYLPLQGSKGEYVIVKSAQLKEKSAIKTAIYLIPLGNHLYKVGANYNGKDKTNAPTLEGRTILEGQLQQVINCPYTVLGQLAAIRPTVKDRRPLVGRHPEHKNIWALNGLGSHGITTAPWLAQRLYELMAHNKELPPAIDIARF